MAASLRCARYLPCSASSLGAAPERCSRRARPAALQPPHPPRAPEGRKEMHKRGARSRLGSFTCQTPAHTTMQLLTVRSTVAQCWRAHINHVHRSIVFAAPHRRLAAGLTMLKAAAAESRIATDRVHHQASCHDGQAEATKACAWHDFRQQISRWPRLQARKAAAGDAQRQPPRVHAHNL